MLTDLFMSVDLLFVFYIIVGKVPKSGYTLNPDILCLSILAETKKGPVLKLYTFMSVKGYTVFQSVCGNVISLSDNI